MAEHPVELVEVALVLHQRGAREIVEILDAAAGDVLLHRLHQRQVFAQRHRHAGRFELMEEGRRTFGTLILLSLRAGRGAAEKLTSGKGAVYGCNRRWVSLFGHANRSI